MNAGRTPFRHAIDFDGTFSAAPTYWLAVIELAKQHDVSVVIVSSRVCECTPEAKCENHVDLAAATGCFVVLTSGVAKRYYCEQIGLKVNWWSDDEPESIGNGK